MDKVMNKMRISLLTYETDQTGVSRGEEQEVPAEVGILQLGLAVLLQQDVGGRHDRGGAEAGAGAARAAAQLRHGRHAAAAAGHGTNPRV